MPKVIELDFTDVEPAQLSGGQIRIAPGTYRLATSLDSVKSSTNKPMVKGTFTITAGTEKGKKLFENFVLPRPGTDDSKFGQQRLLALMLAVGSHKPAGKVKMDLEKFEGKEVLGEVGDELQAARDNYPERTISRILQFHPLAAAQVNGVEPKAAKDEPTAEPTKEEPAVEEATVPSDAFANIDDLFN